MKKLNILNKGIIGVTTVACVLLAAGIAYGNNYISNSNANSAKQGAASANTVAGTNTAKKITADEAKNIALAHAKLAQKDVTFVKAELETDNNRLIYDVDFYRGNVEYDYEISVADGTIISADQDIENYSIPAPASTAAPTGAHTSEISAEKAKQIAFSHAGVGGATFTKVELDTDDGIKVYEIEFKVGNVEYEYDINASNGAIIKSSSEIDD